MPLLDDLVRRITPLLPGWLAQRQQQDAQGPIPDYPIGYAQSRLAPTHPPMVIVPDAQWAATDLAYHPGESPTEAFTVVGNDPIKNAINTLLGRTTQYSKQASADFKVGGPTLVVPSSRAGGPVFKHEATHALTDPIDAKLPQQQVLDLVQHQGLEGLQKAGYSNADLVSEVPARLMTEPMTLNMSDVEGRDAGEKYAQLLERSGNKKIADKYRQFFGLSSKVAPDGQTADRSFQKPNETF